MRTLKRVAVLALAIALALTTAEIGAKEKSYEPPYKEGPSGGDEFNHIEADPQTGEMSIYRLFPGISPVVGCEPEPSGGWAMFVVDKPTGPFKSAVLAFEVELDPYAWATFGVRTKSGDWYGVAKLQGPHRGPAELKLKFPHPVGGKQELSLEFGLQLGDACPQVGYANATFRKVTIR